MASPGHSRASSTSTIDSAVTAIESEPPQIVSEAHTEAMEPHSIPLPPSPRRGGDNHIVMTDSMVEVPLSDAEELRSLPSPTPTLKLVTEDNAERDPFRDSASEPIFPELDETESPVPESPRRFSVSSVDSETQRKGVDWEGLERTEDEHSTKDEESEEVRKYS